MDFGCRSFDRLQAENERLKYRYQDLGEEVNEIKQQMKELENRDNTVYRTIFEAKPIPDSARAMELEKQQEIAKVESIREDQLVRSIETSLKTLTNRITVQKKSESAKTNFARRFRVSRAA